MSDYWSAGGFLVVPLGALVAFLFWKAGLRARPASYLDRLRRRLGPADVLLPLAHPTWSNTCWHCGAPSDGRLRIDLAQIMPLGWGAARDQLSIEVPWCKRHGPPPKIGYQVRLVSVPAALAVLLPATLLSLRLALRSEPLVSGAVFAMGSLGSAGVFVRMRRWASVREPVRLLWSEPALGWGIVRFDDARRAAAIRAEQGDAVLTGDSSAHSRGRRSF